jgi:hypothetical protein
MFVKCFKKSCPSYNDVSYDILSKKSEYKQCFFCRRDLYWFCEKCTRFFIFGFHEQCDGFGDVHSKYNPGAITLFSIVNGQHVARYVYQNEKIGDESIHIARVKDEYISEKMLMFINDDILKLNCRFKPEDKFSKFKNFEFIERPFNVLNQKLKISHWIRLNNESHKSDGIYPFNEGNIQKLYTEYDEKMNIGSMQTVLNDLKNHGTFETTSYITFSSGDVFYLKYDLEVLLPLLNQLTKNQGGSGGDPYTSTPGVDYTSTSNWSNVGAKYTHICIRKILKIKDDCYYFVFVHQISTFQRSPWSLLKDFGVFRNLFAPPQPPILEKSLVDVIETISLAKLLKHSTIQDIHGKLIEIPK